ASGLVLLAEHDDVGTRQRVGETRVRHRLTRPQDAALVEQGCAGHRGARGEETDSGEGSGLLHARHETTRHGVEASTVRAPAVFALPLATARARMPHPA